MFKWFGTYWGLLVIGLGCSLVSASQSVVNRSKIDLQRSNIDYTDKEALGFGREFVRLDSAYYVGWMYQGLFLDDRSADKAGYLQAIPFLKQAFWLIEKDYGNALKTVYNSIDDYAALRQVYTDYLAITRALRGCYENTDKPDSAMWILDAIEAKKFKRDQFGLYGTKAWLIHRNRFFTDGRYYFLKNNVQANAQAALQACYDGFGNIQKNEYQISQWFGPFASEMDRHYLYHYLAMIHSYMQRYDSSEYYYSLMAEMGSISWNNYGSLKHETGELATANQLYTLDKGYETNDKRLREPYYYLPILKLYAGQTGEAIDIAREALTKWQSMPGFGWYNLSHARAFLYDGQLDSADLALQKAEKFKEVHIGTTLTQSQYEFTITLLRLLWYDKKIAAIKLENQNWWYSPQRLFDWLVLKARKYAGTYLAAQQLYNNPERERLIYDLFCGESTVSFDEIIPLMEWLGSKYFISLLEKKSNSDPRVLIKKYFDLSRAYMLYHAGKKKEAEAIVNGLTQANGYDTHNEKLFLARLYLLKGQLSKDTEQLKAIEQALKFYPQLVPFANQKLKVTLTIQGEDKKANKALRKQLNETNIEWIDKPMENIPVANINLSAKNQKYEITLDLRTSDNEEITAPKKLIYHKGDPVTAELLLRIFGKGGIAEPEFTTPE